MNTLKPIDFFKKSKNFKCLSLLLTGLCAFQSVLAADSLVANACPTGIGGPRIVHLSEALIGDCNDTAELQKIIFDLGQTGTLVIDQTCVLDAGLRIPSRFTLKGTGIGSAGILAFTHNGIGLSVCQEEPRGYVTIADLDLYGPYSKDEDDSKHPSGLVSRASQSLPEANSDTEEVSAPDSKGISLANLDIVYLTNIRVSGFHTGVVGTNTYSAFIHGSNISDNAEDNIQVGYASNGWRIRDGLVSRAGNWGINVLGPGDKTPLDIGEEEPWNTSNDLLIDGVRMESNSKGGVRTNAYGTRIINGRFEFNGQGGGAPSFQGILVDGNAVKTRILTNIFSSDCIDGQGVTTQEAHNIDNSC